MPLLDLVPRSFGEYEAAGRGRGLQAALAAWPVAVIQEVARSGLRGRGGQGSRPVTSGGRSGRSVPAPALWSATRLRLAGALWEFWWSRAQIGEGRDWLERALRTGPDAPAAARARALAGAGTLAIEQRDAAAALAFYRQSQALYERLGDRRGVAEVLVGLGNLATWQERYGEARRCSSKRCRRRMPRVLHGWKRSRCSSWPMGSACKAIRPRPGRYTNKLGRLGGPLATNGVSPWPSSKSGCARSRAMTTKKPIPSSGRVWRCPVRWTSGGELFGLDAAGLIAVMMKDWDVAATLFGATEVLRETSPAPHVFGVREPGVAAVKKALDPASLSALWDKGNAMTLEQAIAYALEHL